MTDPTQTDLDELLAQAARQKPNVPTDLMARVMIDAARFQPKLPTAPHQGFWASILDVIGGWPAVGGLAMAGVTGLWIGVAPPVGFDAIAATVLGSPETIDLFGGDMLSNFTEGLDGQDG
jgi:hypothetical protein